VINANGEGRGGEGTESDRNEPNHLPARGGLANANQPKHAPVASVCARTNKGADAIITKRQDNCRKMSCRGNKQRKVYPIKVLEIRYE